MRSLSLQVGAASLMLVACVAAPPSQRGQEDSKDFDKLVAQLALRVRAQLHAAGGTDCQVPPNPAVPPQTECTISMSLITVPGQNGGLDRQYCLAVARGVKVLDTGKSTKYIDWKLDKTDFGTPMAPRPIEFHETAGIVIMRDAKQDLIDKHGRGRGKGGSAQDDKAIFHVETKIKRDVVKLNYLPVIVWDPYNDGNWELCAAVDPKIINSP